MTNINESISSSGLMVRSFTVYKFLTLLSSPFSTFDAFRKGIIDARGNYIKDMDEAFRNGSLDPLEVIIIKLKKIIATSSDPGLKSSLSNNLATFDMFLNEMYRYNILPHESLYLLESHCLKKGFSVIDTLIEDMSVGAGGIPGLSITDIVGPKKRRKKSPMFRRNELMEMEVTTPNPTTPTPEVSPQLNPLSLPPGIVPADILKPLERERGNSPIGYLEQMREYLRYYENLVEQIQQALYACRASGGNCQQLEQDLANAYAQVDNFTRLIEMITGGGQEGGGQEGGGQEGGGQEGGGQGSGGQGDGPQEIDPAYESGDEDSDGVPNQYDTDDDGDGIPDWYDEDHPSDLHDYDNDGIPDDYDADPDGDGIPEGTDENGDGVDDSEQTDTDNDGIPDGFDDDIDGDGLDNEDDLEEDPDGDGIPKWFERLFNQERYQN